ncbi:lysosomal alpha-mannosidase-like [Liolophura sinensis]|uniref:lysosomal alpha-mannosidase-like n=1 Tax=Liolophura sinensis TaxID=3198878 RepID=UPI0031584DF7
METLMFVLVGLIASQFGVMGKTLVFSSDQRESVPDDDTCGYESCNPVKEGMINVHVVPHTHDDVGWIMTVDQYYYQRVQYILDTVIPQIQMDPTRRFIYVEIAFFKRWWDEQDDTIRHIVKGLVNQGRLEFILGAWSMNDEASTHYNAIIDQHTLGFRFLRETFGECARPRVAWQIDPFGHSREQASLFAQMGYDGLFFGRLDYQDKDYRVNASTMEMVWEGSDDLGISSSLFTGALYDGYGPPPGICFAYDCSDPVMDDESLHDYNVPQKVNQFLKDVADQAKHYATDHLIMTMGSDFQYTDALTWYKNLDKIIKYVNQQQTLNNTKVNLLYSTPSCYLKQLNLANKTWTTKSDDFFPYAHRAHSFWTGYFTSRAALKGYVRRTNNFLQVCKQMDALAQLDDSQHSSVSVEVLKEAMGVAQHHDGVSGTEKQVVAYDYAERLANGVNECRKTINDAYKKLISKSGTDVPFDQHYCGLLNISMCDVTENNKQFVMLAYNPLGRHVTRWVRLPVVAGTYNVTDSDGMSVATQLLPVSARTMSIPERKSKATLELVFSVTIPALGFASYFVQMTGDVPDQNLSEFRELDITGADTVLKNKHISLTFDDAGHLSAMENLDSQVSVELKQEFAYYTGFIGNNSKPEFQASGAYIFRPNEMEPHTFNSGTSVKHTRIAQGPLVQEVEQRFSPWVSQVIRLYEDAEYAELEWTVGPIPIDDKVGKEVVNRIQTDMMTDRTFYTDANGRQILKRMREVSLRFEGFTVL